MYGLIRRLKRGVDDVTIFYTMRCNLSCRYCSLRGYDKSMPPSPNELTLDKWKVFAFNLIKFVRPREINVTGGEPTLRRDVSAFINYLLHFNICVSLYSNLSRRTALEVNKTRKFRIAATYHHSMSEDLFKRNYLEYKQKYKIDLRELGKCHLLNSRRQDWEFQGEGSGGQIDRLAITPDGYMFVEMKKFYRHLYESK